MTEQDGTETPTAERGPRDRFRQALGRLGGAQKSRVGVPAYLRYVNRRLGGWLAASGYALGLTPNHLTAISAAFSAAGIAALVLVDPTVPMAVVVALALAVGYAFDSADGQLSRVRGDGKPAGEWLDHVVDVAKTSSLHAGVLISLYRFADLGTDRWLLVPIGFGIVNITFFFGMMLRDQLGGKPTAAPDVDGGAGPGSAVRSLVLLPMDYGTLCWVFVLLASPTAFLVAYGLLFAFMAVFTVQAFAKAHRSLSA